MRVRFLLGGAHRFRPAREAAHREAPREAREPTGGLEEAAPRRHQERNDGQEVPGVHLG